MKRMFWAAGAAAIAVLASWFWYAGMMPDENLAFKTRCEGGIDVSIVNWSRQLLGIKTGNDLNIAYAAPYQAEPLRRPAALACPNQ